VRCEEVGLEPKKICQHVLAGQDKFTPCVGDARQTLVVNEDPKLSVGIVYRCVPGLRCDVATRECIAPLPQGGSCNFSPDCTTDTYCAEGKCEAAVADGAPCTEDEQCKSVSFCSSKGQCAAYLSPGSACSGEIDSRCLDGACVNGKCTGEEPTGGSQLYCP